MAVQLPLMTQSGHWSKLSQRRRLPPPAWHGGRFHSLRQMHRYSQSLIEIAVEQFARDAAAQEVGPFELTEWHFDLGIASGSLDGSRQRAKGIILHVIDGLRHVVVTTSPSLVIVWMSPVQSFKTYPKFVDTERTQIRDEQNSELADAFAA